MKKPSAAVVCIIVIALHVVSPLQAAESVAVKVMPATESKKQSSVYPKGSLLNEDAANDLLNKTLQRDKYPELECDSYQTEEVTKTYFQFALRGNANTICKGDPGLAPVVARFRVYRKSHLVRQWNTAENTWPRYVRRSPR